MYCKQRYVSLFVCLSVCLSVCCLFSLFVSLLLPFIANKDVYIASVLIFTFIFKKSDWHTELKWIGVFINITKINASHLTCLECAAVSKKCIFGRLANTSTDWVHVAVVNWAVYLDGSLTTGNCDGVQKVQYAGKAEVEVAYEYIVVMVAGCNQSGLLLLACIVGLIVWLI